MNIIGLKTRDTGYSMLILDTLRGIEYDEKMGELLFIGSDSVRAVHLEKNTPASDVWKRIHDTFAPLYTRVPRAVEYVELDLAPFQKDQPLVF